MAKLKMLKYPKKPKATASASVKENWIKRAKEVDKENARRKTENAKSDRLTKTISGMKVKR